MAIEKSIGTTSNRTDTLSNTRVTQVRLPNATTERLILTTTISVGVVFVILIVSCAVPFGRCLQKKKKEKMSSSGNYAQNNHVFDNGEVIQAEKRIEQDIVPDIHNRIENDYIEGHTHITEAKFVNENKISKHSIYDMQRLNSSYDSHEVVYSETDDELTNAHSLSFPVHSIYNDPDYDKTLKVNACGERKVSVSKLKPSVKLDENIYDSTTEEPNKGTKPSVKLDENIYDSTTEEPNTGTKPSVKLDENIYDSTTEEPNTGTKPSVKLDENIYDSTTEEPNKGTKPSVKLDENIYDSTTEEPNTGTKPCNYNTLDDVLYINNMSLKTKEQTAEEDYDTITDNNMIPKVNSTGKRKYHVNKSEATLEQTDELYEVINEEHEEQRNDYNTFQDVMRMIKCSNSEHKGNSKMAENCEVISTQPATTQEEQAETLYNVLYDGKKRPSKQVTVDSYNHVDLVNKTVDNFNLNKTLLSEICRASGQSDNDNETNNLQSDNKVHTKYSAHCGNIIDANVVPTVEKTDVKNTVMKNVDIVYEECGNVDIDEDDDNHNDFKLNSVADVVYEDIPDDEKLVLASQEQLYDDVSSDNTATAECSIADKVSSTSNDVNISADSLDKNRINKLRDGHSENYEEFDLKI